MLKDGDFYIRGVNRLGYSNPVAAEGRDLSTITLAEIVTPYCQKYPDCVQVEISIYVKRSDDK
jgi:hypothetical protein